jgi:hypothetical protein
MGWLSRTAAHRCIVDRERQAAKAGEQAGEIAKRSGRRGCRWCCFRKARPADGNMILPFKKSTSVRRGADGE